MKLRLSSKPRRSLLVGLVFVSAVSLAAGWTAGAVAASSGSQATPSATATANTDTMSGAGVGMPATGQVSTEPGVAQSSSASGVVYPYQIDPSLGVAPESTILAAGTGTADMKADGSDRATAMPKATDAALADARAGAQAVATAMGVSDHRYLLGQRLVVRQLRLPDQQLPHPDPGSPGCQPGRPR